MTPSDRAADATLLAAATAALAALAAAVGLPAAALLGAPFVVAGAHSAVKSALPAAFKLLVPVGAASSVLLAALAATNTPDGVWLPATAVLLALAGVYSLLFRSHARTADAAPTTPQAAAD